MTVQDILVLHLPVPKPSWLQVGWPAYMAIANRPPILSSSLFHHPYLTKVNHLFCPHLPCLCLVRLGHELESRGRYKVDGRKRKGWVKYTTRELAWNKKNVPCRVPFEEMWSGREEDGRFPGEVSAAPTRRRGRRSVQTSESSGNGLGAS
ncbi:hypothetical protein VTJ04DRAFT_7955 [Mycothermus thermophilus]|uniref:uncharacterized protein n=1 Tax=Humicola insolens TaxID=85995 RepID=UPI003743BFFC